MAYDLSLLDVGVIVVFLFGIIVARLISIYFQANFTRVIVLYIWHTSFCFLYAWFITQYGGDAGGNYQNSLSLRLPFMLGTAGVYYFTSIFSSGLGLSFLATSLVYNIFGFIGLVAFDSSLHFIVQDKKRTVRQLAELIVFLPSISFWSSAIGKDALAFLSVSLVLWASLKLKKRIWIIIPATLIMLFVRPHIAGILIISLSISIFWQRNISPLFRFAIGVITIITCFYLVPIAITYSSAENISSSKDLKKYIHQKASYNMEGEGSVNISKLPVLLQVGTYLFRPLPFEARKFTFLAASLDNLVLIYLFIAGINGIIKKRYQSRGENRLFLWLYSLMTLLILSTTTANLGISMRQKWMFTPVLILLMISSIGKRQIVSHKLTSPAAKNGLAYLEKT